MRVALIGSRARSLINFRGPLLRAMMARGHEVVAFAPDFDDSVRSQLDQWGVVHHSIPMERAGISPVADLRTMRSLVRLFRQTRPDLVLSYTMKPVVWGSLAARRTRVPRTYAMVTGLGHAFVESGSLKRRAVQRVVSRLCRTALEHADGVFFQNPDDERVFRARGLMRRATPSVMVNGSGVDLAHFAPSPVPTEPVFLLMARLIGDKGIREYREAARELRQRYPHARFLLAGGMDSNPAAINASELQQWQASGDIEYLGHLDDVREALARCAVYVLPSYYREGRPRTVLEAMATGRAIVTADTPGCRETVDEQRNGCLVPPRDAAALAKAMERFIRDPRLARRMGEESLRIAREQYDVHKVNRVILDAAGL